MYFDHCPVPFPESRLKVAQPLARNVRGVRLESSMAQKMNRISTPGTSSVWSKSCQCIDLSLRPKRAFDLTPIFAQNPSRLLRTSMISWLNHQMQGYRTPSGQSVDCRGASYSAGELGSQLCLDRARSTGGLLLDCKAHDHSNVVWFTTFPPFLWIVSLHLFGKRSLSPAI